MRYRRNRAFCQDFSLSSRCRKSFEDLSKKGGDWGNREITREKGTTPAMLPDVRFFSRDVVKIVMKLAETREWP